MLRRRGVGEMRSLIRLLLLLEFKKCSCGLRVYDGLFYRAGRYTLYLALGGRKWIAYENCITSGNKRNAIHGSLQPFVPCPNICHLL